MTALLIDTYQVLGLAILQILQSPTLQFADICRHVGRRLDHAEQRVVALRIGAARAQRPFGEVAAALAAADAGDGKLAALRECLSGRTLDMLFVNAGTTNPQPTQTIGEVSTEDFVQLMITNALSPMRVIESLQHLVPPTGLIGVMSSGQGSIGNNVTGLRELYRGTKAALNMFMRSFAARQAGTSRAMVAMAPGWVANIV